MNFFKPPYNEESIKKQYKALALILHPDKKGNEADFKQMQQEKEIVLKYIQLNKKKPQKPKKAPKIIINKRTYIHIVKIDTEKIFKQLIKML